MLVDVVVSFWTYDWDFTIWIWALTPVVLTLDFYGYPHFLQANATTDFFPNYFQLKTRSRKLLKYQCFWLFLRGVVFESCPWTVEILFPQFLLATTKIVSSVRPQLFPSTSISIHYSLSSYHSKSWVTDTMLNRLHMYEKCRRLNIERSFAYPVHIRVYSLNVRLAHCLEFMA
jgi:hypothetical protein